MNDDTPTTCNSSNTTVENCYLHNRFICGVKVADKVHWCSTMNAADKV